LKGQTTEGINSFCGPKHLKKVEASKNGGSKKQKNTRKNYWNGVKNNWVSETVNLHFFCSG